VLAIDHRFALSHPALVSALSKKSFSSVSSPILACSDFTSTAGAACGPPPGPKISEALASSCDFQVVIWLGWTSKCSEPLSGLQGEGGSGRRQGRPNRRPAGRGRLLMVSPVHGDYRRCQAEIPLIALFKFAEPALTSLPTRTTTSPITISTSLRVNKTGSTPYRFYSKTFSEDTSRRIVDPNAEIHPLWPWGT
jgi:hypothetical protein